MHLRGSIEALKLPDDGHAEIGDACHGAEAIAGEDHVQRHMKPELSGEGYELG